MPHRPARVARIILVSAPLFVHRSWRHAQVLLIGAILAPGRRTVTSLLKIMGRSRERRFVNFHRVLSRAPWCPRMGARILLGLLIDAFAANGPVVLALDDTIERRWGRRIRARGIDRDPVRSSDRHFVKASGLHWMSLIRPTPDEGSAAAHLGDGPNGEGHDLAEAHRAWLVQGGRARRRGHLRHGRLAARWSAGRADPPSPALPAIPAGPDRCRRHRWVLIRDPESRFQPQALLGTDLAQEPAQIIAWFVRRWSVEVTFQEARAHLGVETQRQWSDTAIARTTPCLLALFSIIALLANRLSARERRQGTATAWYLKPQPTFSDALAAVRRNIWREQALTTSRRSGHRAKRRFVLPATWAYALCHAA
jgi:hypothetical protein